MTNQTELTSERIEEALHYLVPIYDSAHLDGYKRNLGTALAALRAEQERQWISVEDRLPDKTGKYLVFYHEWSDGAFLPTYEDCTIRTMRFMNNNKWRYPVCIDKRCEADTHREVTHWMPLPEPPEEGTEHERD